MRFLALLAVVLLSGCSLFSKGSPDDLACPQVGFIQNADRVALSAAEITINGFSGACSYNKKSHETVLELTLPFAGHRNAVTAPLEASVPYFIALLDKNEEVLRREAFSTRVLFVTGAKTGISTEGHTVRIPVPYAAAGAQYKIIISFALTPEQLEYNRANIKYNKDAK